jgi:hypothetical protein
VDFEEPVGVVAMGRPTAAGCDTWQSTSLTDDQPSRFTIPVAAPL